jgi:hypothetical protein
MWNLECIAEIELLMTASQGELCNWSMHKRPGINAPTDIIYPPTRNHFREKNSTYFYACPICFVFTFSACGVSARGPNPIWD